MQQQSYCDLDFDQPWLTYSDTRISVLPPPDPAPGDDRHSAEPPPRRVGDDYWP